MKKTKIASMSSDLPKTPPGSMAAAKEKMEESEEDKMRSADYDLDHLMKAEDIKNDPDKMAYVQKAHAKRTVAMRSIGDLKEASAALAHEAKQKKMADMEIPMSKKRSMK
jgi:hypothetical protein